MRLQQLSLLVLLALATLFLPGTGMAHDIPLGVLRIEAGQNAAGVQIRAPWLGLSSEIPALGPAVVRPEGDARGVVEQNREAIVQLLTARLTLAGDGRELTAPSVEELALEEGERGAEVRLSLRYPYRDASGQALPPPHTLRVRARLFPSDPNHKTLVQIYRGAENGTLEREHLLSLTQPELSHPLGGALSPLEILRQFIREGIHHIFIGPDHILFIVGLLLAGGTLFQILKIVTGFTLAHSLTLSLAALGIVTPSPRLVEPVIALSIVVVGLDILRRTRRPLTSPFSPEGPAPPEGSHPAARDPRLLLAFTFGLIHGFGFASVMGELDLPRYALGWTLLGFNLGVEIGQACILLLALPLLLALTRWNARVARSVVQLTALGITITGVVWFLQRVFLSAG